MRTQSIRRSSSDSESFDGGHTRWVTHEDMHAPHVEVIHSVWLAADVCLICDMGARARML